MPTKDKEQLEELENEEVEQEEKEEQEQEEMDDKDKEIEKWKGRYKSMMKKQQESGEGEDLDVNSIVEKKLLEREVTTRIEDVVSQIPEKYREKFQEEFNELSEGKQLSLDKVDKYIKSALALSVPSDEGDIDQIRATAMANTARNSKQSFKKKVNPDVEFSRQLLWNG